MCEQESSRSSSRITGLFFGPLVPLAVALSAVWSTPTIATGGEANSKPPAPPAFAVVSDQVVRDSGTGLLWQRTTSGKEITWAAAVSYCEALDIDGRKGWRLPSIFEMNDFRENLAPRGQDHRNAVVSWDSPPHYWSANSHSDIGPIGWFGKGEIRVPATTREIVRFEDDLLETAAQEGLAFARCISGRVSKEYITRWTARLRDSDENVRYDALVNRLGRIQGAEIREALPAIESSKKDANQYIREAAGQILDRVKTGGK